MILRELFPVLLFPQYNGLYILSRPAVPRYLPYEFKPYANQIFAAQIYFYQFSEDRSFCKPLYCDVGILMKDYYMYLLTRHHF